MYLATTTLVGKLYNAGIQVNTVAISYYRHLSGKTLQHRYITENCLTDYSLLYFSTTTLAGNLYYTGIQLDTSAV